ncbi:MAG: hypothetical protein M3405_06785 [Acidobacteriota bacterium]|jgi:hypothetical protein|nr:hypothetical protein [Acidobacteriota bacterium]
MSEELKKAIEKEEEETIDLNEENISATGQIILGEIEKIGGILTANTTAQEQGDYNIKAGRLRKEVAEDLAETESDEE